MTVSSNAMRRLAHLGVPSAFHADIIVRRAPRFHNLLHVVIVLVSIAASVLAVMSWSRYVDGAAKDAAHRAHARLYDSDIGAGALGLLFAALCAGGWLCGSVTWRRGSESARNGWAADLLHEPVKNKAITDWLWRRMVRRHVGAAASANAFLDNLGRGMVRDLRRATLVMTGVTAGLAVAVPARISFATPSTVTDQSMPLVAQETVRFMAKAVAVVSGCPDLPKSGVTLIYKVRFADGAEPNLGDWQPLVGGRLDALEAIAVHLPPTIARERFSNPIMSKALTSQCLEAFAQGQGPGGMMRLLHLLAVSDAESKALF